jgi:major type 1 subunit fimbrin (pilin)
MNKKLLVMTLLAGGSFTSMVHAADGTLAITGEIIDAGCDINSGNKNISVPMGKISKTAFTQAGDTAGVKPFEIKLTNCPPAITGASIRFSGKPDTKNKQVLEVTAGSGTAKGVGIGLYDADRTTLIPPGGSSTAQTKAADVMTFSFYAKYIATVEPSKITAGEANANATFTIVYN